jgi:hypothetical protein
MKNRLLLLIVTTIVILLLWEGFYPDKYDPKNPHYIAWKWHLATIDPMRALSTMTHDSGSEHLVVGLNANDLKKRFGSLKTVDEVGPYLRDYCASTRAGEDVLFLNNSDYMVVMKKGRAAELVLCKG